LLRTGEEQKVIVMLHHPSQIIQLLRQRRSLLWRRKGLQITFFEPSILISSDSFSRDMFRRLYRHFDQWLTGNVNPDPIVLSSFVSSPLELSAWKVFSDASFGGKSVANLSMGPDGKVRNWLAWGIVVL
jgi:hypothetical protein